MRRRESFAQKATRLADCRSDQQPRRWRFLWALGCPRGAETDASTIARNRTERKPLGLEMCPPIVLTQRGSPLHLAYRALTDRRQLYPTDRVPPNAQSPVPRVRSATLARTMEIALNARRIQYKSNDPSCRLDYPSETGDNQTLKHL